MVMVFFFSLDFIPASLLPPRSLYFILIYSTALFLRFCMYAHLLTLLLVVISHLSRLQLQFACKLFVPLYRYSLSLSLSSFRSLVSILLSRSGRLIHNPFLSLFASSTVDPSFLFTFIIYWCVDSVYRFCWLRS